MWVYFFFSFDWQWELIWLKNLIRSVNHWNQSIMRWMTDPDSILFQAIRRVIYKNIGKVFSQKLDIMADII